jgi:ABC-type multidrug transport system fused ATPase/permease subunit
LIQRAITRLLKGRTSFVIAHRLSTIRNADQLLILRDGQIIERATSKDNRSAHEQLLDLGAEYYRLYTNQFRVDEKQGGDGKSTAYRLQQAGTD